MSLSKSSINSEHNFTPSNSASTRTYEFEDFRVDAAHLMLYKAGATVPLKPKVVETLVAMLERPGEVISKEELMDRLWHDSFVEETNLSQNIYQLRKTLGNCADGQPFIETFWRRGYRFNGKIEQPDDVELLFATHTKTLVLTEEVTENGESDREDVLPIARGSIGETPTKALNSGLPKRNRTALLLGSVGVIAGLALIYAAIPSFRALLSNVVSGNSKAASAFTQVKMTRITPDLNVHTAAISPDGKYLVYDLNEKGRHSLWVKDVSTGGASRVMPPADVPYFDITFSPDGNQIFYNSVEKGYPNRTIFKIPASGGTPHVIARNAASPITISPDQQSIAFVRGSPGESKLMIANADGSGIERQLSVRHTTSVYESWASNLSWSPDGSRIAVCGASMIEGVFRHELIEVSVADGKERIIVKPGWDYLDDVQWLADQSGLVVRGRETHASPWQIWHVSYPGGEIRRITNDLNDYDDISLSADSSVLAVKTIVGNWNIWLGELASPERARQLTFGGSASDGAHGIAVTPDGKVVFTSPRDGNTDLWIMNPDGSDQKQLTRNAGEFNGIPRPTPDGRSIVFISSRSGTRQIWRMDVDGGNPQQLTHTGITDSPSLSPDGMWVYYTLLDNQKQRIAKIPISGGEPVVFKQSHLPTDSGFISPNGELMEIGFYDASLSQPWRRGVMSMNTGEVLVSLEGFRVAGSWTRDSNALVVVRDDDLGNFRLQPINGGESRRLTNFKGGQIRNFAISPDFTQIAFARGNPTSEAIIITNF